MMKRLGLLAITFSLLLLGGVSNKANASHGAAFELTYDHLGGLQYRIYASFYRECTGISAPTSLTVYYTSSCAPQGQVTLSQVGGTGVTVPAKCITSSVCTQEWKYTGVVTLPQACHDWMFWTQTCCRPGNNQNITGGGMYWEAFLNNLDFNNNNSPKFNSNVAVRDFCVGAKAFFDQSVTEIDGDSISYALIPARQNNYPGVSVTYVNPYSATNQIPVVTPPGLKMNNQTGVFEFTPSQTFTGSFCFMVEEWRWDTTIVNPGLPTQYTVIARKKIGHIMRDLRVIFGTNCTVTPPVPYGDLDAQQNPIYDATTGFPEIRLDCGVDTFDINVPAGAACGSVNPYGTDWKVISATTGLSVGPFIGANTNCVNGVSNRITMKLLAGLAQGNYYIILKKGNDLNTIVSDCGIERPEFVDTLILKVSGKAQSPLTDQSICYPTQGYPTLQLQNGSSGITWYFNGTALTDTSLSMLADSTGTYSATWNYQGCPGSDTITVSINMDPDPNLPDISICTGSPFPKVGSGVPNAALYSWTYNNIPFGGNNDSVQLVGPGTYILNVTDQNGCAAADTFTLTVNPDLQIQIGATSDSVCSTDQAALVSLLTGVPGATDYAWTVNGSAVNINSPGLNFAGSGSGLYILTVTTDPNCTGTDSIFLHVDQVLPAPDVSCAVKDETMVTFSWDPIPGATGYLVSIDGGATWVPSSGITSHDVDINIQTVMVKATSDTKCPEGLTAVSGECFNPIIVPNVITPSVVDGKNDVLRIPFLELYTENSIVIYNRWGRKVYEASPYKNDWDGGDHSDGTYYYILNLNDEDNQVFKGNITILK